MIYILDNTNTKSMCISTKHKSEILLNKLNNNPLNLNVTFKNSGRELNEMRKYQEEHVEWVKRVKFVENKIKTEFINLKMMSNVQNIQIQKLNEIFYGNLASLYFKLAKDFAPKYLNKIAAIKAVKKEPNLKGNNNNLL